jgi:hypothetical protein
MRDGGWCTLPPTATSSSSSAAASSSSSFPSSSFFVREDFFYRWARHSMRENERRRGRSSRERERERERVEELWEPAIVALRTAASTSRSTHSPYSTTTSSSSTFFSRRSLIFSFSWLAFIIFHRVFFVCRADSQSLLLFNELAGTRNARRFLRKYCHFLSAPVTLQAIRTRCPRRE